MQRIIVTLYREHPTALIMGCLACLCLIPAILFVSYGTIGGMPWDYTLVHLSDLHPGIKGFIYDGDRLRKFTSVFYHIGFYLSHIMGMDGGWIGYHLIYTILWCARIILLYLICRQLDVTPSIALIACAVAVVHGSDLSIGHVGQMNQYGLAFWTLLSIYSLILFLKSSNWRFPDLVFLLCAIVSCYFALWSHEASLLALLLAPLICQILIWEVRTHKFIGLLLYASVPAYYSYLMLRRMVLSPTGTSFQEGVMRHDMAQFWLMAWDFFRIFSGLFNLPIWILAKMNTFLSIIANPHDAVVFMLPYIAITLALYIFVVMVGHSLLLYEVEQTRSFHKFFSRYRHILLGSILFTVLLVAPFAALQTPYAGYWRTQIIASPWASLSFAILYASIMSQLGGSVRSSLYQKLGSLLAISMLISIGLVGIVANTMSYHHWTIRWERVRAPVQRLLQAVPNIRPGTVILLQDVPPRFADWGSNFWFDILVRLAYPGVTVAGSYTNAYAPHFVNDNSRIISGGGTIINKNDMPVAIAPHGHLFAVQDGTVKSVRTYLPILLDSAPLQRVVALQWTDEGPFQIVKNAERIHVLSGSPAGYAPEENILRDAPNRIAANRFFRAAPISKMGGSAKGQIQKKK